MAAALLGPAVSAAGCGRAAVARRRPVVDRAAPRLAAGGTRGPERTTSRGPGPAAPWGGRPCAAETRRPALSGTPNRGRRAGAARRGGGASASASRAERAASRAAASAMCGRFRSRAKATISVAAMARLRRSSRSSGRRSMRRPPVRASSVACRITGAWRSGFAPPAGGAWRGSGSCPPQRVGEVATWSQAQGSASCARRRLRRVAGAWGRTGMAPTSAPRSCDLQRPPGTLLQQGEPGSQPDARRHHQTGEQV